ncbi:hypothetical protein BBAD15_g9357 [Beauveria bassiana D1-5]|uniref:Uncharacterized protein n=1 Tax=Beauveria bassiana D1-5 TaxID=1245745 RepID=A0A0A2VGX2_BEABA|nr:hypothetical protein BBAD15_g9357 [Beauveria bassiana D1-5]
MSPLHNTVIIITLLCIALCNAAIFYTTFQIIRILRCTSNQFLVFAAELLDLLDPPPPPSPAAVNGTPSVRSCSMASDSGLGDLVAGHAGRDASLSPVLAGSPPPFTDFKVLPLNEEELWPVSRSPSPQERENLGLVMCSREESPNGRQLGYPAAREGRTYARWRTRSPGLSLIPDASVSRHECRLQSFIGNKSDKLPSDCF